MLQYFSSIAKSCPVDAGNGLTSDGDPRAMLHTAVNAMAQRVRKHLASGSGTVNTYRKTHLTGVSQRSRMSPPRVGNP
jgi:hypothetical protein